VLDLPNVAYAAASSASQLPVRISYKQDGAKTTIRMSFPQFKALYYDPVASIEARIIDANITAAAATTTTAGGSSKNAAGAALASAVWLLLLAATGSAVLLAWL
jgi:hypothetical protein